MPKHVDVVAGPYVTPDVRIGHVVYGWTMRNRVAVWGTYEVTAFRDGPILWPQTVAEVRVPRPQLIVFGDLERAIRTESIVAVMQIFGVSRSWVEAFRRSLHVPRQTLGTATLMSKLAKKMHTDQAKASQRAAMARWANDNREK